MSLSTFLQTSKTTLLIVATLVFFGISNISLAQPLDLSELSGNRFLPVKEAYQASATFKGDALGYCRWLLPL